MRTTFAMSAARAPAYVALPKLKHKFLQHHNYIAHNCLPLKTKLTVKKYVPMGNVIMANVKLISFQMTELFSDQRVHCIFDGGGLALAPLARCWKAPAGPADRSR